MLLKDPRFAILRALKPTISICDDRHRPTELAPLENEYPAEWERWRIGYGAVGAAFEANQENPLRGSDERPIGVLSVSALSDKGFADRRIDKLKLLGSELGVLVELIL
jgi:hypothetical protein